MAAAFLLQQNEAFTLKPSVSKKHFNYCALVLKYFSHHAVEY
jgi:hypothetical protein